MKTKFYLLFLVACMSVVGVKAQNYPGYEYTRDPFSLGIVAYAYYDLQADQFVFDQTFSRKISNFNLPFASSIEVRDKRLRFVVSKADFKEYFLNRAVKGQTYFDIVIEFSGSSSSYWNGVGQNEFGYIMLMFPKQP